MKVFSITLGVSKIEFSVWKVGQVYEARVNELAIYRSTSYSACSEAISDETEMVSNVFAMSGEVH